jgi:predicted dehydrogenase
MKIGFIGGYGHHYLRGLLPPGQSPVAIEAACAGDGLDNDAARRWADAHGVSTWFDEPIALFDQFKPDCLSIGSIYAHNGDFAAEALQRGLPTVCDKPIAATGLQLDRLRRLCAARPQILLTEFDFRCRPDFRAARQAIAAGRIGQVILATAQKSYRFGTRPNWYADRAEYGGTLLWIASHAIDAMEWVTGRKIRQAVGRQGNLSHPEYGTMEDHLSVLLELDNGGTGVVHADFLRPAAAATHGDDRMRIAGSDGVVEVRDDRCKLITRSEAETDITASVAVRPIHLELLAALTGGTSEWFSTEQSLATAEILLRARQATDARQWVAMGDGS